MLQRILPIGLCLLGCVIALPAPAEADISQDDARKWSMAALGGWMTDSAAADFYTPWEIEFRDSYLAGAAISRRLYRYRDLFDIEIEGQVVRHFGDADHWEFNVPIIGRWRRFPWDDSVDTSLAFGLGAS